MTDAILIRPAEPDDAPALAPLIVMAGGGIHEFLLDGLVAGMSTIELLVPGLAAREGSFSYRHCAVAEAGGAVVGVAHAYPADWMRSIDRSYLPADRRAHIASFEAAQDWGSYFLSSLAVAEEWRGRGIGAALLARAEERGRTGGHDRLTLHAWADNAPARRFYARHGFVEAGGAAIPWHPRLPHHGGSVLLLKHL